MPFWESREHIGKILGRLFTCQPAESSGAALADTKKAVFGADDAHVHVGDQDGKACACPPGADKKAAKKAADE